MRKRIICTVILPLSRRVRLISSLLCFIISHPLVLDKTFLVLQTEAKLLPLHISFELGGPQRPPSIVTRVAILFLSLAIDRVECGWETLFDRDSARSFFFAPLFPSSIQSVSGIRPLNYEGCRRPPPTHGAPPSHLALLAPFLRVSLSYIGRENRLFPFPLV